MLRSWPTIAPPRSGARLLATLLVAVIDRSISGDAVTLAVDPRRPGRVFAGMSKRVFETTNGGRSWRDISVGLRHPIPLGALALDLVNPSTRYAGSFSGVFKTTDGGRHWRAASTGLF
jgi:hypothetical protein